MIFEVGSDWWWLNIDKASRDIVEFKWSALRVDRRVSTPSRRRAESARGVTTTREGDRNHDNGAREVDIRTGASLDKS